MSLFLFSLMVSPFIDASMIDFYKRGPIVLKPDPDYAKLDYESLFYDNTKHIAVAQDGAIFVSNSRQHNIFKFKDGKLVTKFGRDGLGTGDTRSPREISILDNKYLVIQEDPEIRMISVFDLNGKFVKKIKTPYWVWNLTELGNNKIAILTWNSRIDKDYYVNQVRVIIKNIQTDQDITVASFDAKPQKRNKNNRTLIKASSYDGDFFLSKIGNGNLLFGYSDWSEISIYSPEGKKINSFKVNYRQKEVTDEMKEDFRQVMMENAGSNQVMKAMLKDADWTNAFPELVPFYRNILLDSDDNILVFEHSGFNHFNESKFQIYTKDGKYLGDSKINFGNFRSRADLQLIFRNGFIYSLLQVKNADDILLNFVKIKAN